MFKKRVVKDHKNYESADEKERALFKDGETVLSKQELCRRKRENLVKNKVFGDKLDNLIENVKVKI